MKHIVLTITLLAFILGITLCAYAGAPFECYAHVYDYYTGTNVSGATVTFHVHVYIGGELEIYNEQGVTNGNGYCYIYIAAPQQSYTLEYIQATVSSTYLLAESEGTYSSSSQILYPYFYLATQDPDKDAVNDNVEVTIAEKFAPVLIKADDGHFNYGYYEFQEGLGNFKQSIDNYSELCILFPNDTLPEIRTGYTDAHYWEDDWCSYASHFEASENEMFWLIFTFSNPYFGAQVGDRPLYYHVYKDGSYFYVQYWYWFNMNDLSEESSCDEWHEGDWEHISIRLNYNSSTKVFTPDKINLYQHHGGHTKSYTEGKWVTSADNPNFSDTHTGYTDSYSHPLIFIAANAHASYFYNDLVYYIDVYLQYHEDRVDYDLTSGVSIFTYDDLEKLGETQVCHNYTIHGHTYDIHAIFPLGESKPWLGFVGRCGTSNLSWAIGNTAPHVPSYGIEYYGFSVGHNGFGNTDSGVGWKVNNYQK